MSWSKSLSIVGDLGDPILGQHLVPDFQVWLRATSENAHHVLNAFTCLSSDCWQKIQSRLASDEDLKFSDTLRYYASDAGAAKDLLYRRSRALADYEAANRNLDKARAKAKDIEAAEDVQFAADERFKSISDSARLGEFCCIIIRAVSDANARGPDCCQLVHLKFSVCEFGRG